MSTAFRSHDHWQDKAACRSPQVTVLFYPPYSPEPKSERIARESYAKAICKGCTVSDECLKYALDIDEPHGIWGGKTELERKKLKLTQAIR
jgi:WhiB family redox-sensing transcriptional regulator